jgi:thiol-disulfide isomerase/thioredoxin
MNKTVVWIIGGVVGFGLVVLLAMSIVTETELDESAGFGEVEVTGDPLPFLGEDGDVAIGFTAPTVHGADWDDNEYSIEADGRPKVVIFLAHWCPHCQAEVPVVQDWLDAGNLPEGVDMYAVSTSVDHLRPNWPPQDWLVDEGWTVPTIMDDEINSVSTNYGMTGTPFYAVLDGDNTNLIRVSGEIGVAGLETLVTIAEGSITNG